MHMMNFYFLLRILSTFLVSLVNLSAHFIAYDVFANVEQIFGCYFHVEITFIAPCRSPAVFDNEILFTRFDLIKINYIYI